MNFNLTAIDARVLGALVEKEITTPEHYPLSLNALVNACNQKSNRDPVMSLDEDAVRSALRSLSDQFLVRSASGDSRVAKFEHRLQDTFNFYRPEIAVLCELLLRGPQTPGELRSRAERMHPFTGLSEVHSALQRLIKREPPLASILPRRPGEKEQRYTHLLCGSAGAVPATSPASPVESSAPGTPVAAAKDGRIAELEREVAGLRKDLDDLRLQFAAFQKQFQ